MRRVIQNNTPHINQGIENTNLTPEQRSLLKNYESLLRLATTDIYVKADDIAPYLGSNAFDFRHACLDGQYQGCFPFFAVGKDRPILKIPVVPFLIWISGIQAPTIYEAIELVAAA